MSVETSKVRNVEEFGYANDNLLWTGIVFYAFFILVPYVVFFIFSDFKLFIIVNLFSQVLALLSIISCAKKVFSNNVVSENKYKIHLNDFDFYTLVFALRWNKISPCSKEIVWSFLKGKFPERERDIPNIYK